MDYAIVLYMDDAEELQQEYIMRKSNLEEEIL